MVSINWWRTDLSEREIEAVSNTIRNRHLSNGPIVEEFENAFSELLGVPYAVATTSGTMALVISLLAHDIGPGDEVIVPCSTWISTAHAPLLLGAKIVLVDVLPDRPIIDCQRIEEKISNRTRAILPVHLNGRAADMRSIKRIADKHGLVVIEDACQAILSRNADGFLGIQSDAGCFSLGVTKLITTGQGGIVITRDRATYEKLLLIRNNGMASIMTPDYVMFGANFKFTDILASIGLVQLKTAYQRVQSVTEIYKNYENVIKDLSSIQLIPVDYEEGELPLYVEVVCNHRRELMGFLYTKGIVTRVLPPSLNNAPQFHESSKFPNSTYFGERGMYLPSGTDQSSEDLERVFDSLRKFDQKAIQ